MKKAHLLFTALLILFPIHIYSQSGFQYKATLRDNAGNATANRDISIRFSIYQNSIDGTPIYQEEHKITTDTWGTIFLEIGKGHGTKGEFSTIVWSEVPYFIETAVDQGSGYTVTGSQEMLSVPYAQYTEQTGGLKSTGNNGQTYQLTVDDLGNLQTIEMPKGYTKLVFQDEFNGTGLPDPNKWSYEVGFKRNKELQYYTNERIENVFLKDGLLNIKCINKDTLKDQQGNILNRKIVGKDGTLLTEMKDGAKDYYITSGSITTRKKGDWTYCRVEARIKVALGSGTWPAVWMMPTDSEYGWWPNSGEIDIMEYVGNEPNIYHCALHCLNKDTGSKKNLDNVSEWHVVALEWHEDRIEWYIDDDMYFRYIKRPTHNWKEWPFDQDFYLMLNFAFAGGWGGVNNTRFDTSILPQTYQVDYVRVFQ